MCPRKINEQRKVHVWKVDLSATEDVNYDLLAGDERNRTLQFHFEADRQRYAYCRAVLRTLLGSYLSLHPREIHIDYGPAGKPVFMNGAQPEIHFNVSHSDKVALIAMSRVAPLGVDVERVRELPHLDAMLTNILSVSEWEQLLRLPVAMRNRALFTTWTRKESLVKALGVGLGVSLQAIDVCIDPREPPQVKSISESFTAGWKMWSISVGRDYEACLSMRATECDVEMRELTYSPLLENGSRSTRLDAFSRCSPTTYFDDLD
jgi:4'-phosphopantetheinyl transferase